MLQLLVDGSLQDHESALEDRQLVIVYDLLEAGYTTWWIPALGLIFVAVALLLRRSWPSVGQKFWRGPQCLRPWFPGIFLGFSIFWTLAAFAATYAQYRAIADAYENGGFAVT